MVSTLLLSIIAVQSLWKYVYSAVSFYQVIICLTYLSKYWFKYVLIDHRMMHDSQSKCWIYLYVRDPEHSRLTDHYNLQYTAGCYATSLLITLHNYYCTMTWLISWVAFIHSKFLIIFINTHQWNSPIINPLLLG